MESIEYLSLSLRNINIHKLSCWFVTLLDLEMTLFHF